MASDHLDVTARTRVERVVNLRPLPLDAGTMSMFRVGEGWVTPVDDLGQWWIPPSRRGLRGVGVPILPSGVDVPILPPLSFPPDVRVPACG